MLYDPEKGWCGSTSAVLRFFTDFKRDRLQLAPNEGSKVRNIENLLTELLTKACWLLSNVFAEGALATKHVTPELFEELLSLA